MYMVTKLKSKRPVVGTAIGSQAILSHSCGYYLRMALKFNRKCNSSITCIVVSSNFVVAHSGDKIANVGDNSLYKLKTFTSLPVDDCPDVCGEFS